MCLAAQGENRIDLELFAAAAKWSAIMSHPRGLFLQPAVVRHGRVWPRPVTAAKADLAGVNVAAKNNPENTCGGVWRRVVKCRLQVSEDSRRVPWLWPSFYLGILPSYRVTSSALQRILFLDYTQRGILFPTVKIRWQSGSHRTWGLMGEQLCDRLLDDSAEQSLGEHHSAWQPLRGRSRRIAIDFLFQKQHKACPQQAQLLKIHLCCSCSRSPKAEPRFSLYIIQEQVQQQPMTNLTMKCWHGMLGKYGVVKGIICSDRNTTAAADCRKDSW